MNNSPGDRRITSTANNAAAGLRLDVWLAERFTYRSRNQWQELIKDGKILLNDRTTRSSRLLQENDRIAFVSDHDEPPAVMDYQVVFEDDYCLAVNKCGNLPCHPAGPFFKNTLWYDLTEKYGRAYIANRLDRETSGLLLAGKTSEAAAEISALFIAGRIRKKYFALVYGDFDREIHASGYLMNDLASAVRKKRRFVPETEAVAAGANESGETAITHLSPVKRIKAYSLVEAIPETGRLHQIRATLCSLGFPLLGDKLYGPDDTIYLRFIEDAMTDEDREKLVLPRQALHACTLEFQHPRTGKAICLNAPLPPDMQI